MGLRANPSQRQKRLGQELQRLREPTGMSAAEAGALVGLGRAHMSHIEAGRTHISAEKIRTLAEAYRCTRGTLVEELVRMAESTGRGWWSEYKRLLGSQALDLAELELTATGHRSFQWLYVPGLLQTPDYIRTLFQNGDANISADLIDRYVDFRLHRQQVLTEDPAPQYHAVIHEAAFHMGFVDSRVMGAQLEYLIQVARFPNITIQVMPFNTPSNPAAPGAPFTIFDAMAPELRTVYVEQPVTSGFLSDLHHIAQFTTHFARLSNVSLAPLDPQSPYGEGSFGLLQHLLYTMKEGKRVGR
ncbi:helix-turn-helix domain-containing protein [Streptomyces carpaticus]|uniref:Helix-turn-helix domain-containing protein n=1 Tax=Streptomyces carpaticus TaxID=285558 RepID=A0ABV4ZS98_9ACTN